MGEGPKGDYQDIDPKEKEVGQKVLAFIKVERLGNEGLASTLETTDGIRLDQAGVEISTVDGKMKITLKIIGGTEEGRRELLKAVTKYVVTKVGQEIEVELE